MPKGAFESSDSVRTGRPLKYALKATLRGGLDLEMGGRLEDVAVTYETYGRLNRRGDNAVLICHALSGDSHVARHDPKDDPGWWDVAVGPGKPIDTRKHFVICPNILGGCRGTTGPSTRNPRTGKPYGEDFPTITTGDIVEVQRRLVEHLGIRQAARGRRRLDGRAPGADVGHALPGPGRRGGGAGDLGAADRAGAGVRRDRPQRHPARPAVPRRPVLPFDQSSGHGGPSTKGSGPKARTGRRSGWPWRACSGTSPISRRRR